MTFPELWFILTIYALVPVFCLYQIRKIGKTLNRELDEIYTRHLRAEEVILDTIEFRENFKKVNKNT